MACLATSIPPGRRKAARQFVDPDANASRVGQLKQLPLGRIGPTAPAPVADRAVAHAKRPGNGVHATKFVDQGHARNKDTICSVSQGRNVACNGGGFRHDTGMSPLKNPALYSVIGRRLAATRNALGIDQDQMAEFLCCTRQALSHYENGRRKLTPEMMIKIWHHHGISPEYYYLGLLRNVPESMKTALDNLPEVAPIGRPPKKKATKAKAKPKAKLRAAS